MDDLTRVNTKMSYGGIVNYAVYYRLLPTGSTL
jgi:hypothetical protein